MIRVELLIFAGEAFQLRSITRSGKLSGRQGGLAPALPTSLQTRIDATLDAKKTDLGDETWRVFCAVALPRDLHKRLTTHINCIREAVSDVRASWSRAENIHLTLKFVGDVPQASIQSLSDAASRAVIGLTPFTISLEQTGVFPKHGSPRVLWIGVSDLEGKLGELQARLESESEKAGFPREPRPFHPHITLARLRQPQNARSLASAHNAMEFEPAELTVSELLVIRSELSSTGSHYTIISQHPLNVE